MKCVEHRFKTAEEIEKASKVKIQARLRKLSPSLKVKQNLFDTLPFLGGDKTIWVEMVLHSYRTVGLMLIICGERSWGARRE